MRELNASELPKPTIPPGFARLLRQKYPKVYVAASIADMMQDRSNLLDALLEDHDIFPLKKNGDPERIGVSLNRSAVVFLPKLRHYPVGDPNNEQRILGGLLKREDQRVRLRDRTGELVAAPDKNSFMEFPYIISFHSIVFGTPRFDEALWREWRGKSWERNVVLLAQFSTKSIWKMSPKAEDVIDRYWLLHIFDAEYNPRRVQEAEHGYLPVPVLAPIGA